MEMSREERLKLIKEVGFDFSWSEKEVWALEEPVVTMSVSDLAWHFDVPFWDEHGDIYNLSPREVFSDPKKHKVEWERIQSADISHPLDVMQNKGRWLLLDGLHRLSKQHLAGSTEVQVRIIPRTRIPEIMNLGKTKTECKRVLSETFPYVYEWHDEPGVEYPSHAHKDKVSMFIVGGGLTFQFEDGEVSLITGDRFDVPVGKEHTAKVGPAGCDFIVGEMIDGDS